MRSKYATTVLCSPSFSYLLKERCDELVEPELYVAEELFVVVPHPRKAEQDADASLGKKERTCQMAEIAKQAPQEKSEQEKS